MSNRCIHVFIGCNAQNHPHITKERGNDDTFNDDEFKYGPRLGSYGLANSKLASSLLNSNEHDVRNTHYATQQGKDADYPKGSSDDAHTRFHLHGLCKSVPNPYRILVVGGCSVVAVQAFPIVFLKGFIVLFGFQAVEREMKLVGLITFIIYCAHSAESRKCPCIAPRIVFFTDADNLKTERTHIDIPANKSPNVSRSEFTGLLIINDKYLS